MNDHRVVLTWSARESADFVGAGNNTNLALKGIIGIGAMAEMSKAAGQQDDAKLYNVCA